MLLDPYRKVCRLAPYLARVKWQAGPSKLSAVATGLRAKVLLFAPRYSPAEETSIRAWRLPACASSVSSIR